MYKSVYRVFELYRKGKTVFSLMEGLDSNELVDEHYSENPAQCLKVCRKSVLGI